MTEVSKEPFPSFLSARSMLLLLELKDLPKTFLLTKNEKRYQDTSNFKRFGKLAREIDIADTTPADRFNCGFMIKYSRFFQ